MHADAALDPELRHRVFPNSNLTGPANLLIFPNLDAANIAFNLMKNCGRWLASRAQFWLVLRSQHIF